VSAGDWLIVGVVALQSFGGMTYLFQGQWLQAAFWLGVAVANAAVLGMSR
jgi:hypothetical protein